MAEHTPRRRKRNSARAHRRHPEKLTEVTSSISAGQLAKLNAMFAADSEALGELIAPEEKGR